MNTQRPALTQIPTPKYHVGQKVFWAHTSQTQVMLPCPDCLGTRTWKVITPGGTELETECQRCERYQHDLPSIRINEHTPVVRELTIGSIRIDTAPSYGKESHVEYMCEETGVGSGSIYEQHNLYATRDEALAVATLKAAVLNEKENLKPSRLEARRISGFRLKDATLKDLEAKRYKARCLADHLRSLVEEQQSEHVEYNGDKKDRDELLEELERLLRFYADPDYVGEPTREDTDARIKAAIKTCLTAGLEVGYTEEDGDEYRVNKQQVLGHYGDGTLFPDGVVEAVEVLFERWDGDNRP